MDFRPLVPCRLSKKRLKYNPKQPKGAINRYYIIYQAFDREARKASAQRGENLSNAFSFAFKRQFWFDQTL
ncbi:MAG: hypothetical protein LBP89_04370 [Helicobacteraceae bacterium]|nr:hypothetical protein [Helicobacteraceae bacterium]